MSTLMHTGLPRPRQPELDQIDSALDVAMQPETAFEPAEGDQPVKLPSVEELEGRLAVVADALGSTSTDVTIERSAALAVQTSTRKLKALHGEALDPSMSPIEMAEPTAKLPGRHRANTAVKTAPDTVTSVRHRGEAEPGEEVPIIELQKHLAAVRQNTVLDHHPQPRHAAQKQTKGVWGMFKNAKEKIVSGEQLLAAKLGSAVFTALNHPKERYNSPRAEAERARKTRALGMLMLDGAKVLTAGVGLYLRFHGHETSINPNHFHGATGGHLGGGESPLPVDTTSQPAHVIQGQDLHPLPTHAGTQPTHATTGFQPHTEIEVGHGYTDELQDVEGQQGINIDGAKSFELYSHLLKTFPELHGNLFEGHVTYQQGNGDYGLLPSHHATWNPAVLQEIERFNKEHNLD